MSNFSFCHAFKRRLLQIRRNASLGGKGLNLEADDYQNSMCCHLSFTAGKLKSEVAINARNRVRCEHRVVPDSHSYMSRLGAHCSISITTDSIVSE